MIKITFVLIAIFCDLCVNGIDNNNSEVSQENDTAANFSDFEDHILPNGASREQLERFLKIDDENIKQMLIQRHMEVERQRKEPHSPQSFYSSQYRKNLEEELHHITLAINVRLEGQDDCSSLQKAAMHLDRTRFAGKTLSLKQLIEEGEKLRKLQHDIQFPLPD